MLGEGSPYNTMAWPRRGPVDMDYVDFKGLPEKKVQKFAGTDRQVRGKLLDVLRGAPGPVPKVQLDIVWNDVTQREKCLVSLLSDGLVEQSDDGLFHLPGEGTS